MAIKTITRPTEFNEFYTDTDKENVYRIIDWMNASRSRSNRWLSRCVGCSDASISTLLTGKNGSAAANLINKILPVMEDTTAVHEPGEFVETSIWSIIKYSCEMAKEQQGFAIVAGTPGVGKSESLKHYQKLQPNTIYICGSEVINATAVIDMLLVQLGIKSVKNLVKAKKVAAIVDTLKDTGRLIILDEADKCQKDTPDPLRTISDATGCGVVLAGNVNLRNMVRAGDNRYDLIESRVVFWPEIINKVSPADVELLMRPYITPTLIAPGEQYEDVVRYAFEVVDGSARKLIKSLIRNTLKLDGQARKNGGYRGISREMIQQVAKNHMGIPHPPAIPRKNAVV